MSGMHGASREALAAARERLDALTDSTSVDAGSLADELAAVTALLLARAAAGTRPAEVPASRRRTTKAGWRRLERQHGFRAPHSWQG